MLSPAAAREPGEARLLEAARLIGHETEFQRKFPWNRRNERRMHRLFCTEHGDRSSVGRVPDCDSGCRGFEPRRSPHLWPSLNQGLEAGEESSSQI